MVIWLNLITVAKGYIAELVMQLLYKDRLSKEKGYEFKFQTIIISNLCCLLISVNDVPNFDKNDWI